MSEIEINQFCVTTCLKKAIFRMNYILHTVQYI